eukprot:270357-Prymnesium_polylepis.3
MATYFEDGIAGASVQLALVARQTFGWAARVPKAIWSDAVLPYAVVNEARNDWRPLLWAKLLPTLSTLSNSSSLADVFKLVNAKLWGLLGSYSNTSAIVFRSEQTPLIYDPMSTYATTSGAAHAPGVERVGTHTQRQLPGTSRAQRLLRSPAALALASAFIRLTFGLFWGHACACPSYAVEPGCSTGTPRAPASHCCWSTRCAPRVCPHASWARPRGRAT